MSDSRRLAAIPSAPGTLDGRTLTVAALVRFARPAPDDVPGPGIDAGALRRVAQAHATAVHVAATGPVYGQTTGVGANRAVVVPRADADGHALRLLRSHAGGFGVVEDDDVARAAVLVRLNQLLAGGSGVAPPVVEALAAAVAGRAVPTLHRCGSIGTGDLSALAELALTLAGERPWRTGSVPSVHLGRTDGLALISSNAVTIGVAALTAYDLRVLLDAAHVVAALSFAALRGSAEAYAEAVHRGHGDAGQVAVAATMRRLLADHDTPAARIQDPFALRAVPQVHGSAVDALTGLLAVLTPMLNTAAENPLMVDGTALHHAQFHTAALGRTLDTARATLHPLLALSTARLAALVEPELTGLSPFLAADGPGSSGVMVLEYLAHDALAEVRQTAMPAGIGGAVVSRGLEEHASFSTQSARATAGAVPHARVVLAGELIAAVRALRADPRRVRGGRVAEAFATAAVRLDPDTDDRSLGADVAAAVAVLPDLAALVAEP